MAQDLRDSCGGVFAAVDTYDLFSNATFPATQFYTNGYRALLVFSRNPWMNNGALAGESCAKFVQLGGGVVDAVWADNTGSNLQGAYLARYMCFPHGG